MLEEATTVTLNIVDLKKTESLSLHIRRLCASFLSNMVEEKTKEWGNLQGKFSVRHFYAIFISTFLIKHQKNLPFKMHSIFLRHTLENNRTMMRYSSL